MPGMKHILTIAVIALVVVAIVFRFAPAKRAVTGMAA